MNRAEIFELINKERERQNEIHTAFENLFKALGNKADYSALPILVEEVGEVAKAIQEGGNVDEEIVQVAAVCVRWLENRKG